VSKDQVFIRWQIASIIATVLLSAIGTIFLFKQCSDGEKMYESTYLENAKNSFPRLSIVNDSLFQSSKRIDVRIVFHFDADKYQRKFTENRWQKDTIPNAKWFQNPEIIKSTYDLEYVIRNNTQKEVTANILLQGYIFANTDTIFDKDIFINDIKHGIISKAYYSTTNKSTKVLPNQTVTISNLAENIVFDSVMHYHLWLIYENDSKHLFWSYHIVSVAIRGNIFYQPQVQVVTVGKIAHLNISNQIKDSANVIYFVPIRNPYEDWGIFTYKEAKNIRLLYGWDSDDI